MHLLHNFSLKTYHLKYLKSASNTLINISLTRNRVMIWFVTISINMGNANGAPGALVKDTKKGNYIVIIALKTV